MEQIWKSFSDELEKLANLKRLLALGGATAIGGLAAAKAVGGGKESLQKGLTEARANSPQTRMLREIEENQ
jgi:hypothetical protein